MELETLVENKRGSGKVTDKIKIKKKYVDDELGVDDEIPIDREGVEAEIISSDEFDIPPTWIVMIKIDLEKL